MFLWCFKCRDNDEDDIVHHLPRTRNTSVDGRQKDPNTGLYVNVKTVDVVDDTTPKSKKELQQECLDAHNKYRAMHNVPPLALNKRLNTLAQEWAQYLATSNTLQHRKNNKYGENLYMATCMGPQTHVLAVKAWYDEIEKYNFNRPGFSPNTGHFTQVIWRNTKELGVGVVTKGSRTWIVCNYDPTGNIMGHFFDCVPVRIEDKVAKVIEKMKAHRKFMEWKREGKIKTVEEAKVVTTAPATAVGKSFYIWSKFELECLDCHNKYRALHGVPNMRLNKKLCNLALNWSAHLAENRITSHRPNNEYGENIYYAMNIEPTGEQCVTSWYNEIKHYNFSNPGFTSQTGHFTQVVWKNSVELGVGITKIDNMTFVVCNYSPAGNVMGEYQQQVPPPIAKPKTSDASIKSSVTTKSRQSPKLTFEEACLQSHNNYREMHGSPPLTLNKNLNFLAKDWARHLATENKIQFRKYCRFGENIFFALDRPINGADPVEHWYSGIKDFNFRKPVLKTATEQFTQVVWKKSEQLGVGVAKVGNSSFVVCNYDPKGNINDEFDENVPAIGGDAAEWHGQHQHPNQVDMFTVNMLKFHNIYRSKHGSPDLKLSGELMRYAKKYANHVILQKPFLYTPSYVISTYNINNSQAVAHDIVTDWYQEIEKYDFKRPEFNIAAKHFTQLVWKSTKFMGVGLTESGSQIMVAVSYEPAGNVDRQYGENVSKPTES